MGRVSDERKALLCKAHKAAAWDKAADVLAEVNESCELRGYKEIEWAHIRDVIIPSLRRRAEIIRRRKTHG